MNKENVKKAIAIMQRAKKRDTLYMPSWQSTHGIFAFKEEEFHSCGNKACFAGHIAISPEFQEDGGSVDKQTGAPVYSFEQGYHAIKKWLDISESEARSLVHGNLTISPNSIGYSRYYEKEWHMVEVDDVISKLELMLEGKIV